MSSTGLLSPEDSIKWRLANKKTNGGKRFKVIQK